MLKSVYPPTTAKSDFKLQISTNNNIKNLKDSACRVLYGNIKLNCSMSGLTVTIPSASIGTNKAFYPAAKTILELSNITILTNTPLKPS